MVPEPTPELETEPVMLDYAFVRCSELDKDDLDTDEGSFFFIGLEGNLDLTVGARGRARRCGGVG